MSHTETKEVTYYSGHVIEVGGKRYALERTCHPVCPERLGQNGVLHRMFHRCSRCGHDLPYEAEKGHCGYCPECGARVVE